MKEECRLFKLAKGTKCILKVFHNCLLRAILTNFSRAEKSSLIISQQQDSPLGAKSTTSTEKASWEAFHVVASLENSEMCAQQWSCKLLE